MKSRASIVSDGGRETHQVMGKPRARFFGFLSLAWLVVSVSAVTPFLSGWPESFDALAWICVGLLVLEPVFIVLAFAHWLLERPRLITEKRPNPNHDIRKLY